MEKPDDLATISSKFFDSFIKETIEPKNVAYGSNSWIFWGVLYNVNLRQIKNASLLKWEVCLLYSMSSLKEVINPKTISIEKKYIEACLKK